MLVRGALVGEPLWVLYALTLTHIADYCLVLPALYSLISASSQKLWVYGSFDGFGLVTSIVDHYSLSFRLRACVWGVPAGAAVVYPFGWYACTGAAAQDDSACLFALHSGGLRDPVAAGERPGSAGVRPDAGWGGR